MIMRIGILRIDGIQHIQCIQDGRPSIRLLIIHLVEPRTVITIKGIVDQRVFAIGEVLDQPIPVADAVKGFPAVDIPAIGRIIDDIQRFLEIRVAASQGKGIEIQTQDKIDIIGQFRRQVGGERFRALYPVLIEIQGLVFHIAETEGFVI